MLVAGATYPDGDGHVEPYATASFGPNGGAQSVTSGPYPEGTAGGSYGTAEGSNEDHSLGNGKGQRGLDNDHTRATAAGKPPKKGVGDTSKDPFDTVPGVDGSPWKGPDPVYRRPGRTTQRP